jgi:hypothetical protein
MSDYFIKHFYDQVKDPIWPEITTYNDFLKLPESIVTECNTIHNFPSRLSELEDEHYWQRQIIHNIGYQYNNTVYVPVLKCAHSYYTNFFRDQLGWAEVKLHNLNWNNITAFGLLMNPMTRRVKGITQVLTQSFNDDYDSILQLLATPNFSKFIGTIQLLDAHTVPYHLSFGKLLNKIHWIPMEPFTDEELKNQITCFLATNNVSISIPNDKRINQSSSSKQKVFTAIQNIFLSTEPAAELGLMFAKDIKFYNNLLNTYAPLHNNNQRRS